MYKIFPRISLNNYPKILFAKFFFNTLDGISSDWAAGGMNCGVSQDLWVVTLGRWCKNDRVWGKNDLESALKPIRMDEPLETPDTTRQGAGARCDAFPGLAEPE